MPFLAAASLAVAASFGAYAGKVPAAVSAHGIDKVLHATAVATLTIFLARALRGRAWLAAVVVLVPFAVDEYLQRYSAVRTSDWGDLLADIVGAVFAVLVVRRWHERELSRTGGSP